MWLLEKRIFRSSRATQGNVATREGLHIVCYIHVGTTDQACVQTPRFRRCSVLHETKRGWIVPRLRGNSTTTVEQVAAS